MKNDDLMILGVAALAVLLILKSGKAGAATKPAPSAPAGRDPYTGIGPIWTSLPNAPASEPIFSEWI